MPRANRYIRYLSSQGAKLWTVPTFGWSSRSHFLHGRRYDYRATRSVGGVAIDYFVEVRT